MAKDINPLFFFKYYSRMPSHNACSFLETAASSMLCCWSDRCRMDLCRPHTHCNLSLLNQFSVVSHKVKAANTAQNETVIGDCSTSGSHANQANSLQRQQGSRSLLSATGPHHFKFGAYETIEVFLVPTVQLKTENKQIRKSIFLIICFYLWKKL